ncbi:VOC family protein [Bacillus massiliigorillae]|uniref:VOC family protein n=1 Tax=Bacillus massiliigorillae TaxID=1243664 RepID=UPI0003A74D1F|nr:VOC family protein [Bacillus massiliigorillae]
MGFHTKPNLYIRNVTLNVSNLNNSLLFYRDFLGFKVLEHEEHTAILTADGVTPLIKLNVPQDVTPKQSGTTGLYHFAILLPSRADLGKFLLYLVKQQFRIGASDHLVSEALYFSDPDGNGIEVYCDRHADTWTWHNNQVAMTTDPLDGEGVLAAGDGLEWNGMPPDTVMGHIHLHVSNLQKAGTFYSDVLGYEVVCEYGGQALFLSTGKYHHHVAINTWNGTGVPAEDSVGLKEYAIDLPNEAYKQKVIRALEAYGIPFNEEEGILHTKDPSGNKIAMY